MALFTAAETYFFNESIMEQRYIVALLWAILILRNFRVSYIMGKIVNAIDDHFRGKK
ncbi:PF11676 family protein [Streptococcus sp. SK140]|nr:PF11676 family protein [Streptococcus sp. SK140]